jgi:hypothetical protein
MQSTTPTTSISVKYTKNAFQKFWESKANKKLPYSQICFSLQLFETFADNNSFVSLLKLKGGQKMVTRKIPLLPQRIFMIFLNFSLILQRNFFGPPCIYANS